MTTPTTEPRAVVERYLADVGLGGCLEMLHTDPAHFAKFIGTSVGSVEDWIAGTKKMPQPLLTERLAGFLTFTRQAVDAIAYDMSVGGHVNYYPDEERWQKALPLMSSVCPVTWWHAVLGPARERTS